MWALALRITRLAWCKQVHSTWLQRMLWPATWQKQALRTGLDDDVASNGVAQLLQPIAGGHRNQFDHLAGVRFTADMVVQHMARLEELHAVRRDAFGMLPLWLLCVTLRALIVHHHERQAHGNGARHDNRIHHGFL
ncbi:hypothetical protein ORF131R [Spotted knifejaw iridovirus]|uniref:ORF133R n=1 Tax=Giant seaperch iridovirus TaxID=176655 RepID=A0A140GBB3_GSIV|nr:ORF133R [giant sea perch iridovirus - K1]WBR81607.1 hypothetical protein ORF131R [Spotted knifejaw iridovirus]